MGVACSAHGEKRNAYKILVGNPEGKSPRRRPRRRWKDNKKSIFVKKDLGVWIGFIWLRTRTGGGLFMGSVKTENFLTS
jgi:hypothetical protein